MKKNLVFPILSGLLILSAKAQNIPPVREVFLYQNGYTYIHRAGDMPVKNKTVVISGDEMPQALFGTYWFSSPQKVVTVRNFSDTLFKTVQTPTLEQSLASALGQNIRLVLALGNSVSTIQGRVTKIFDTEKVPEVVPPGNNAIAVIQTADGPVFVYRNTLEQVLYCGFDSMPAGNYKSGHIRQGLMIEMATDKTPAAMDMVYVEVNPAWSPAYHLSFNGTKAVLKLSAEVSSGNNELEKVRLNLVTSSPQLAGGISRLVNPFSPVYGVDFNGVYNTGAVESRGKMVMAERNSGDVMTGAAEDYYIYTIRDFSLQKNQSALVKVFEENTDIEHSYQTELNPVTEFYRPVVPASTDYYPVFHHIGFVNPVKQPLTNAPVFVETPSENGGELLLGQPRMQSVPPGGKADIIIAQSQDMPVNQEETETGRIAGAKSVKSGTVEVTYDQITVSSVIHIENRGSKERLLLIHRRIEGKTEKSDADWKVVNLPVVKSSPNPAQYVTWNVSLKPGEKKDIKYTYSYYLRN